MIVRTTDFIEKSYIVCSWERARSSKENLRPTQHTGGGAADHRKRPTSMRDGSVACFVVNDKHTAKGPRTKSQARSSATVTNPSRKAGLCLALLTINSERNGKITRYMDRQVVSPTLARQRALPALGGLRSIGKFCFCCSKIPERGGRPAPIKT